MLDLTDFTLQEQPEDNLMVDIYFSGMHGINDGLCTLAAKPIKFLDLHYAMIQFLIIYISSCQYTRWYKWIILQHLSFVLSSPLIQSNSTEVAILYFLIFIFISILSDTIVHTVLHQHLRQTDFETDSRSHAQLKVMDLSGLLFAVQSAH